MVGKDDRRGFELADGAGAGPDPLQALAADALLKDQAEETHLLYVALTRARDRVFVLGGDKSGGSPDHDSPLRRLLRSADNAGSSEAMVQERPAPPPLAERLPAEPRADETAVADQAPEIPPSLVLQESIGGQRLQRVPERTCTIGRSNPRRSSLPTMNSSGLLEESGTSLMRGLSLPPLRSASTNNTTPDPAPWPREWS